MWLMIRDGSSYKVLSEVIGQFEEHEVTQRNLIKFKGA